MAPASLRKSSIQGNDGGDGESDGGKPNCSAACRSLAVTHGRYHWSNWAGDGGQPSLFLSFHGSSFDPFFFRENCYSYQQ